MLGYQGNRTWLDVSDYVIHLSKDGPPTGSAYENMMGILSEGRLEPGPKPFGCARGVREVGESQRSVCFSEMPLGYLQRLVQRRRCDHGIGFRKAFARARGAAPIWYVEYGSEQHGAIEALKSLAGAPTLNADHPVWRLTPFIDVVGEKPQAPYDYDFQWEREWRSVGAFDFEPQDVAFLLLPEDLHQAARDFFHNVWLEDLGPAYSCPYIDPSWSLEQTAAALAMRLA